MDDEKRNPIDFGSQSQRSRSTLALCVYNLVGNIQIAASLSLITFKLHMQVVGNERRTLLILGRVVKGQGQLWFTVYKNLWAHYSSLLAQYRLQFLHFQTSQSCKLRIMSGRTLSIFGCGVKGQGRWINISMLAFFQIPKLVYFIVTVFESP